MENIFISFEGGEGSGKTTQINLLKDYLISKDKDVLVTRDPGGTVISEKIRKILLDVDYLNKIHEKTELFLYMAARTQLLFEKILPALNSGKIVICDRFYDATLAYQGHARKLGINKLYKMHKWALNNIAPDLTFYLDVDPETGLKRESEKDRFNKEGLNFHKKVREGYNIIANKFKDRLKKINTNEKDINQTFNIIKKEVDKIL